MVIRWEPWAKKRLREIYDYYCDVASVRTARDIRKKIEHAVGNLAAFPSMGPMEPGMDGLKYAYRSIVAHPYYKVIYRIENDTVYITTIWDCRQDPVKMKKEKP